MTSPPASGCLCLCPPRPKLSPPPVATGVVMRRRMAPTITMTSPSPQHCGSRPPTWAWVTPCHPSMGGLTRTTGFLWMPSGVGGLGGLVEGELCVGGGGGEVVVTKASLAPPTTPVLIVTCCMAPSFVDPSPVSHNLSLYHKHHPGSPVPRAAYHNLLPRTTPGPPMPCRLAPSERCVFRPASPAGRRVPPL